MLELLLALLGVAAVVVAREAVRRRVLRVRGQLAAIAAGTAVSYVGTVAIVFVWALSGGLTVRSLYTVHGVIEGFDADGKLAPGDIIVATDGVPLELGRGPRLVDRVAAKAPAPIVFTVERDGVRRDIEIRPQHADNGRWLLGIEQGIHHVRDRAPSHAARFALAYPLPHLTFAEPADPGGPTKIVEEIHVVTRAFVDDVLVMMMYLARLALYAMLVADAARAVLAMRRR